MQKTLNHSLYHMWKSRYFFPYFFTWILLVNSFNIVEENFELLSFEMVQNEGYSLGFSVNTFIIVEENFEFHSFEM